MLITFKVQYSQPSRPIICSWRMVQVMRYTTRNVRPWNVQHPHCQVHWVPCTWCLSPSPWVFELPVHSPCIERWQVIGVPERCLAIHSLDACLHMQHPPIFRIPNGLAGCGGRRLISCLSIVARMLLQAASQHPNAPSDQPCHPAPLIPTLL